MAKYYNNQKIVACLDLGSSKLICIIAAIFGEDIKILGYAHKKSLGISASAISDMKLAQKAISSVVSEAEKNAGVNISKLLVSVSAAQINSDRKDAKIKISADLVRQIDINNLASEVLTQYQKNNRQIIHLIPLQYRIDDSSPVHNPRYMAGKYLHAKFHIASTSLTTTRNIENCLRRCQLSVNNYIVEPYASALACLNNNELSSTTLLIDIGGSTTSFCIMREDKLIFIDAIAYGGMNVTKDIATILNVNFDSAENIKSLNNSLIINPREEMELVKFKSIDPNDGPNMIRITRSELRDIMKARIEEIFENIKDSLDKKGVNISLINNVVLTGGGASTIGIDKVAGTIFGKNIRLASFNKIENFPAELYEYSNSCSAGMLLFLKDMYLREKITDGFEVRTTWLKNIIEKLVSA